MKPSATSPSHNAVIVNRHWRDRIDNDRERMQWMRGVLMHDLRAKGIQVTNVRLRAGYWEMTCSSAVWSRISDITKPVFIGVDMASGPDRTVVNRKILK